MDKKKTVLLALLVMIAAPIWADDIEDAEKLELQRQQLFQTGFPVSKIIGGDTTNLSYGIY